MAPSGRKIEQLSAGSNSGPAVRKYALTGSVVEPWADLAGIQLPFEAHLSFAPLIAWWREADEDLPKWVAKGLEKVPELDGIIDDVHSLERHQDFLHRLLSCLLPAGKRQEVMSAVLSPLTAAAVYTTAAFERILLREGSVSARLYRDAALFADHRALSVYAHIVRSLYGLEVPEVSSFVVSAKDPESGLDRYFSLTYDLSFVNVRSRGDLVPLSDDDRQLLVHDPTDLQLWLRVLPPVHFILEGIEVLHASDITEYQVLSMLKTDLLEADSIASGSLFPIIVERLRTFLHRSRLSFGLAYADGNHLTPIYKPMLGGSDCLFCNGGEVHIGDLDGSIFGRSIKERTILVADELKQQAEVNGITGDLYRKGIRSLAVLPLLERGKLAGMLYLWSSEPGDFAGVDRARLFALVPLFVSVVQRFRDELQSRIQAVILGEYTAIHPAVEWRFRQAAYHFVRQQDQGRRPEVEPIIFDDVFPMYAAADIRGSSTHRNEAVQYDLLDQLAEVENILDEARRIKPLPIIEYLQARTSQYRTSLQNGLTSDDEMTVKDYLQRNIGPLLQHIRTIDPILAERVSAYEKDSDLRAGRLYQRCRSFEDSVQIVNRALSSYLDAEEAKAQALFPHYFEKHETDGIEFSMYVGASLVEDGTFDPIYVRNLRLWQLMVMCGMARRVNQVKKRLDIPLEVTQLILSQSTPISIRFQLDEMRFDVDGTYDIRYEIMKRRVDKALLKGANERLTQPGKVAIVYSQAREAWEYEEYIRFLQLQGLIVGEAEDVELADLQGLKGLKALRVTVNLEEDVVDPDVLEKAIETLSTT